MAIAAALIAVVVVLAIRSLNGAFAVIPSLNIASPLARVEPTSAPAPRRLARRVFLVMIDGLRLDTSYGRSFLDELRARGIDAEARTHFPSMSRPNHTTIVTGVEPRYSGVRTNMWNTPVPLDTVMARAHAAGLRVALFADGEPGMGVMYPTSFDDLVDAPFNREVMLTSAEDAIARGDELVLLWLADVDDAGHKFGAASPEYREAARRVDEMLARLLSGVDLQRDAIVVCADHGHIDRGGHGGLEPEVMAVPLVLAGAGVKKGATLDGARLADVAPTVAALLGLPAPGHALGRTLTAALDVDAAEADALTAADDARIHRLRPIVDRWEASARRVRWDGRTRRIALAATLVVLLLAATIPLARRRTIIVDGRVLWLAVPVFPILFYGLLIAVEPWLSPSMLPAGGRVADKLFGYGAAAALAYLAAAAP
jgi:hypothetical protein